MIDLYNGDCLEVMDKLISDGVKVDAIIADPPYGTTACKWDSVIPFEEMWKRLKALRYDNTPVALFGSEPFSSALRMSNVKEYRYDWIQDKVNQYTGVLNANKRPMKRHEEILVFFKKQSKYNKQFRQGKKYNMTRNTNGVGEIVSSLIKRKTTVNNGNHNPCSIIEFKGCVKKEKGLHPTQKPVALMEYLVKTYTNEGGYSVGFYYGFWYDWCSL